jgi:proteasome lid subunit RPN8/RPN11
MRQPSERSILISQSRCHSGKSEVLNSDQCRPRNLPQAIGGVSDSEIVGRRRERVPDGADFAPGERIPAIDGPWLINCSLKTVVSLESRRQSLMNQTEIADTRLVQSGESEPDAEVALAPYEDHRIRIRLVRRPAQPQPPLFLNTPQQVYELLHHLECEPREQCIALYVDPDLRLIGIDEVARGDSQNVSSRVSEVFKGALLMNCHRFIIAHNHPHGNPEPSKNDIRFTEQLDQAARILGMEFVDHIIVGFGEYFSFSASTSKWSSSRVRYGLSCPQE